MTVDKIKDGWVVGAKMRAPGNASGMCARSFGPPTSGKSNG
jgi:hypothetical protein